jgi:uncharacterized membrane protein YecN with MAPEG domain
MAQHSDDFSNAAESGFIGIAVSFFLNQVMPWTIHTIGALLSGAIVAASLFFFNRWLKNRYK